MLERGLGDFLSWARDNGAILDSRIEFQYSKQKGYSALIHDFLSGEELIKIPKRMVIGPHLKEQYLPGINAHSDSSFTNNEMTILLISKLAFDTSLKDNHFKPYFEILPKDFNIPYFWNSNEIDLVNGTVLETIFKQNFSKLVIEWHELMKQLIKNSLDENLKQQILQDMKFYDDNIAGISLNSYHGELYEYLKSENRSWTSFRNYVWSYSILTSRGFPYILLKNEVKRSDLQKAILIPIFDLLNHKNDYKVKWNGFKESKGSHISFQSFEKGDEFGELYNNYGDKSNLELLLGYGFVSENNKYDESSISFKLNAEELIKEALKYKILENQNNDDKDEHIRYLRDGINFKIKADENLPSNLVNFFAILMQMGFERDIGISLRMQLNGITHLKQVIEEQILLLKKTCKMSPQVKCDVYDIVKVYRNEQRKIFQNTLESLLKYEKSLLADNKAYLLSLKTMLKNDVSFKSSLIKIFKVSSYEEILKKQIVNDVALLWIVTLPKLKDPLCNPNFNTLIRNLVNYICSQIEEVSKAIDVTDEDIEEYRPKVLSSIDLLQIWPNMFKNEIDFIRQYVIADTVFDRLSYTRPSNGELFFVQKVEAFA